MIKLLLLAITTCFVQAQTISKAINNEEPSWEIQYHKTALYGVVWAGSQFVAVGEPQTILTSPDGLTWTKRFMGPTLDFQGVAWSGKELFVVGSAGAMLSSRDGIYWISAGNSLHKENRWPSLSDISWTGNEFIAVGDSGTVVASTDGLEWRYHKWVSRFSLFGTVKTDKLYVSFGFSPKILTSQDATHWSIQESGLEEESYLSSGAWSGKVLVLAGGRYGEKDRDSAIILTMGTDEKSWKKQKVPGIPGLNAVIWSGSKFVAVGNEGTIIESTDGIEWKQQATPTCLPLYDIAWSGERFVAVGAFETILSYEPKEK